MHYSDPDHIKNAILEVVLYIEPDAPDDMWKHEWSSIQNCKYIKIDMLVNFKYTFRYKFKDIIDSCKEEGFYFFTFKTDGYDLIYDSHKFVTDEMHKNNKFLTLH